MQFHRIEGILPPHLIDGIVARHPELLHLRETPLLTQKLWNKRASATNRFARMIAAGKSEVEIYDANEKQSQGKLVRAEGQPECGIEDADFVYTLSLELRKFIFEVLGRNGIDANGMKMMSTVRYGRKFNNAFWDSVQMWFGAGDRIIFATFVIPSVYGHEVEHGVTEHHGAGKFVYRWEPGQINEHLSDARGATFEMWRGNIKPIDYHWIVGKGIFMPGIKGVGIRHMEHPGEGYNDPANLGKDPQMAKYSKRYTGSGDNGGVHINSGFGNRVFALTCKELNDWMIPTKIWHAARAAVPAKPSWAQFAATTIDAAKKLGYGKYEKVLLAGWTDVEIEPNMKLVDPNVDNDDVESFMAV